MKVKGQRSKVKGEVRIERGTTELRKEVADSLPTGIVKNAAGDEVYEASYEGYLKQAYDREVPSMREALSDYCEILKLHISLFDRHRMTFSGVTADALNGAMKQLFNDIAKFLSYTAGKPRYKKPKFTAEIIPDLSRMRERVQSVRDTSSRTAPKTESAPREPNAPADRQGLDAHQLLLSQALRVASADKAHTQSGVSGKTTLRKKGLAR